MFCDECGQPLKEGASFCSKCGNRLDSPTCEFLGPFDIQNMTVLQHYIDEHSADQLRAVVRATHCDPTDLLAYGDALTMFLKRDEHALVLFQEGLDLLEHYPDRIANDTNLAGAYANVCRMLTQQDRLDEALSAYRKGVTVGLDDAQYPLILGVPLFRENRYSESLGLLEEFLSIPGDKLPSDLPMQVAEVRQLRAKLHGLLNAPQAELLTTLGDLTWWFSPEVEPIPAGLSTVTIEELIRRGVDRAKAARFRSAVICQVSKDRKMWWVGFYEIGDPRPLAQRDVKGDVIIGFHAPPGENLVQISSVVGS